MSRQKKISRGFLLLFSLSLLLAACGEAEIDVPAEVMTEQPTSIPTGTPVPTPTEIVLEYTRTPDFEDFLESYIPVEELLDGSYWNWLNETYSETLAKEFKEHEDKIIYIEPKVAGIPYIGGGFIYRPNKLEYEDPETRPWKRDVTFAYTSGMENGNILNYIVLPVFYYDKITQQVYPVVSVMPIRLPEDPTPDEIEVAKKQYLETMNIPSIIFSESPSGKFVKDNMVMNDSIVGKSYAGLGPDEVWKRTNEFYNGDVSAFSSPDMVVLGNMGSSNAYK